MTGTICPDLDSLRCFAAAARRLSFCSAAHEVGLSPPAFSERIRRLEELLGTPLFRRTTRRVELTRSGVRLGVQAARALDEAARCAVVVRDTDAAMPFELTIGTGFEVGLSWLLPLLPRLSRRHPERALHLRFGDSSDLLRNLREGAIDAVVSSTRSTGSSFDSVLLHEQDLVFVASPLLLRARSLRNRPEATAHVLIDASGDLPLFRSFLDAQATRAVWSFSRIEKLGTIAAIRRRVLAGKGVAVLPRFLVQRDLRSKRLVALFPSVRPQGEQFRLVWSRPHAREVELRELAGELSRVSIR